MRQVRSAGVPGGERLRAEDTIAKRLDMETQRALVEEVRAVLERSPLVRPKTPNGMPMRVRVSAAGKLGWVGDGEYRYDPRDSWGNPWPPMPARWLEIANEVAGEHPWDSAIINWYDPDASLGWHQDRSEKNRTLPIVTISLGDAASWAIRKDEGFKMTKPSRAKIGSGDVTLLAGPTRGHHHSIERVIPEPLLSPLTVRGRISITIRVAG
jgi:alkylated DNA repair protein (DNA oxidative demethylase)